MPRTIDKKPTTRNPVTAQETFRYTTPDLKVTARPVDPYVRPAPPKKENSSGLASLVTALNQLNQVVQSKQKEWDKENFEKGQVAAFKGEQLAPGSPEAMVQGFESLSGQAAMVELQAAHENLLMNSQGMAPDEFMSALKDTTQQFTSGKSDTYLMGLMKGGALGLEKRTLAHYQKMTTANVKEDIVSKMATAFSGQFSQLQDRSAESTHQLFTSFQEQAVQAGIPRKVASDRLLEVIGQEAVRTGNPELMSFAYLPHKGVQLARTDSSEKVQGFMQQALHSRDRIEANTLREQARREKEAQEYAVTEAVHTMYNLDPSKPDEFRGQMSAVITAIDQSRHQLKDDYKMLRKTAEEFMERGGYPKVSDPSLYYKAEEAARAGELTSMMPLIGRLTKADFNHISSLQSSAANRMENRNYSQSVYTGRELYDQGLKRVRGEKGMMPDYPEGYQKREELFQSLYLKRREEAQRAAEAAGGVVLFDTLYQIQQQSLQDVFKELGDPSAPVTPKKQGTSPTQKSAVTQTPSPEQQPSSEDAASRLKRLIGK